MQAAEQIYFCVCNMIDNELPSKSSFCSSPLCSSGVKILHNNYNYTKLHDYMSLTFYNILFTTTFNWWVNKNSD